MTRTDLSAPTSADVRAHWLAGYPGTAEPTENYAPLASARLVLRRRRMCSKGSTGRTLVLISISSLLLGCGLQKTSLEEVETGGPGEVWLVVEETQGDKALGYVVHHCTPSACKAVGALERLHKEE